MLRSRYLLQMGLCVVLLLVAQAADSQITIRGTVFDISKKSPLEGVSVMANSGAGTTTDILGNYSLRVRLDDSIYFSYLGKPTPKFAVKAMMATNNFDVSLHVNSNVLPEVFVRPRSYKQDSIQNRLDYAKIFNYHKPRLDVNMAPAGSGQTGVGFDLDGIIDMLRFKKQKSMLLVQERMVEQERDRFINHRFTKGLVKKLTNLDGEDLALFMRMNRPGYDFTVSASEYEFYSFIKENAAKFRAVFLTGERKDSTSIRK